MRLRMSLSSMPTPCPAAPWRNRGRVGRDRAAGRLRGYGCCGQQTSSGTIPGDVHDAGHRTIGELRTDRRPDALGQGPPALQVGGAVEHDARHADGDDQRLDRGIISLPAIFRGVGIDPLQEGNVGYLLWMIMGFLLVSAVLVVTFGRLGDMYGRVRIYTLGFVVFTVASLALGLDPMAGGGGALWLIGWRVVQGVGSAMLFANSAAILTDAFPSHQRGLALGINQVAALAGSFLGLIIGGLLAELDWRAVFWVSAPVGLIGTIWSYRSLHELGTTRRGKLDLPGNLTFAAGLSILLI